MDQLTSIIHQEENAPQSCPQASLVEHCHVCVRMTKVDQHTRAVVEGGCSELTYRDKSKKQTFSSLACENGRKVTHIKSVILLGSSDICYSISWYVGFVHVYDACVHQHSGV